MSNSKRTAGAADDLAEQLSHILQYCPELPVARGPVAATLAFVREAFLKYTCNAFHTCGPRLEQIGLALYLATSLLNHSCRPNCWVRFDGRVANLIALRAIAPGEELLISYVDHVRMPSSRHSLTRLGLS